MLSNVELLYINFWNKSMMLLNLIRNNQNGRNILNISILLLLMGFVMGLYLHLIIWMNKLTLRRIIKHNFLKLNWNFKVKRELFMIHKSQSHKETPGVSVIFSKDGSTRSSPSPIISQDSMRQHREQAVVLQLGIIWLNAELISMLNTQCQRFLTTWTRLWKIPKASRPI